MSQESAELRDSISRLSDGELWRMVHDERADYREEAIAYATPTELDGVVERVDDAVVAEIRALPTVFDVDVKVGPGSRIRPTVDLFSGTMRVFMCAADYADIQRDHERLQGLKDRVFVLR